MLQVNNKTPFASSMVLLPDAKGIDTIYAIVKASFHIGSKWTLLEEQIPPNEADEYWGDPESSSLKIASDYHIGKPSSDILVLGSACSPGMKPVKSMEVGISVGKVSTLFRVFGDRHWIDGVISPPEPFQTMPMVYEKAFGGIHLVEGEIDSSDDRNSVGCGFAGTRKIDEMDGVPLPNIEDPRSLIQQQTGTGASVCC